MSNDTDSNLLAKLSDREFQVLKLLIQGMHNKQIAKELNLSNETIKSHMKKILTKLCVSTRTQAAVKAITAGWIEDEDAEL